MSQLAIRSISPARGYEILANPNLDPETVTTIELGFAYRSRMGSDGFSVKGAYYSSAGDDFIDIPIVGTSDSGLTQYQAVNVNKASITGFEVDARFQQRALAASVGFASTIAKNDETDEYLEGNNVPRTLKTNFSYQIGSSGTMGFSSLFADEDDNYNDDSKVPGYEVHDLYYRWVGSGELGGLTANASVSNALDESYSVTDGGTVEEGRSYNFKLSYKF